MDLTYVEEIARQLHLQKPDHLVPGRDVGMTVVDETALELALLDAGTITQRAVVRYQPGPDHYQVSFTGPQRTSEHDRVYCDDLGPLIFGAEAKPLPGPLVVVGDWDAGPV